MSTFLDGGSVISAMNGTMTQARIIAESRPPMAEQASICSSDEWFWPHDPRKVSKSRDLGAAHHPFFQRL